MSRSVNRIPLLAILGASWLLMGGAVARADDPGRWIGLGFTDRYFTRGLRGQYGAVPCLAVQYSTGAHPGISWALSAGYGRKHGDSGRDPTFDRVGDETLEVIPIEVGLRFGLVQPRRLDWSFGVAGLALWMRERLPAIYTQAGKPEPRRLRASLLGIRLSTGPRWSLPWHHLGVEGTAGVEITGEANEGSNTFVTNGASTSWRLALLRRI